MPRMMPRRTIALILLSLASVGYGLSSAHAIRAADDASSAKNTDKSRAANKRGRGGRGRRGERAPDRLKTGDPAPDFKLKTVDGKKTVRLSGFRGKKPVALIFGSYT